MGKVIHCKFCDKIMKDEEQYAGHIVKKHPDMMIPEMTPRQFVYFLRTGKKNGQCVICKNPTKWNSSTNKYHRFCENPECKEKYREMFKDRMMNKYGKISLLNDPEQQKKMLAARKISGVYEWRSNPQYKFTYTGSYEQAFLEFLDLVMDWSPIDLMTPSPHTYFYKYNGEKHFYIPDIFIPSLDLEIEIKDGGDNPNNHPKIQAVDKEKEKLKDEIFKSPAIPFNYLKIVNKDHSKLLKYLEKAKEDDLNGKKGKIIML